MFREKNLKLRVLIDKDFGETGGPEPQQNSIKLREFDIRSEAIQLLLALPIEQAVHLWWSD
jgi:hypothetical protein